MATIHLHIAGKVQGVFYRATAKEVADRLNLSGWIKNKKDDTVEAVVTGDDEQLKKFVDWCKQGPEKATVEKVIVTEQEPLDFKDFVILR